MDLDAFFAKLNEQATDAAQSKVELETAQARVAELEASLAALTEERDGLKAKLEDNDVADKLTKAEGQVAQLTTDLEAVTSFLSDEAKKALVAAGTPDKEIPENAQEIATLISETRLHLHSILPEGGVAQPSVADAQKQAFETARLSGFKTARR